MDYISFDSQLNVEFNAIKIKNIPNKPKIDIAEKHHHFSLFLSYLMNTFDPAIRMYFCELVLIVFHVLLSSLLSN